MFPRRLLLAVVAGCAGLVAADAARAGAAQTILDALNAARTDPGAYADALARDAAVARGDMEFRDAAAVAEAIAFLRRQPPLPPLAPDRGLDAAAMSLVAMQGPTGQTGHVGPDGSDVPTRIRRAGLELRAGGEDISYGERSPAEAVMQLIIDSGVPDRGHRRNIFDADFGRAGAACGYHRVYRDMCVIDFGGAPLRP